MSARKRGGVRLTKTVAKKLIRRIARGAEVEDKCNRTVGADVYEALVESLDLVIKCENDWYAQNERINLSISDRWGGGHILMCIDPGTLERDQKAEEDLWERMRERTE